MGLVTIEEGALVTKDPADAKVFTFDWDADNLAASATISQSTWTITQPRPFLAWSSTTAYKPGDRVLLSGTLYLAIVANTNVPPPNTTYWSILGADTPLTKDNESVLTKTQASDALGRPVTVDNRVTQVRLSAGTLDQIYEIANRIVTSESPSQTKERSFQILVSDK